jgi:hypothetical protein
LGLRVLGPCDEKGLEPPSFGSTGSGGIADVIFPSFIAACLMGESLGFVETFFASGFTPERGAGIGIFLLTELPFRAEGRYCRSSILIFAFDPKIAGIFALVMAVLLFIAPTAGLR